jgi:LPXTG-site transpeptidase (sortase) family protein
VPRTANRLLSVTGAALVLAGAALGANVAWFYQHSASAGATLVRQVKQTLPDRTSAAGTRPECHPAPAKGASGLLVVPSIGLTAPVVEGTANPSLDLAVGHVEGSAWPGESGTSVLSAHDVTWFSNLDHVKAGDQVQYETSCGTWSFRVVSGEVVKAGTPVLSGSSPRLALITCYPLNALYFTDRRYVVEADLVGAWVPDRPISTTAVPVAGSGVKVTDQVAALAAQMTHVTRGSLHITGSPDPAWLQSNAPLDATHVVIQAQDAAMLAAKLGSSAAWARLGTHVPEPSANPLAGVEYLSYPHSLDVTLQVAGDQVVAASTSVIAQVRGPDGHTATIPITARFTVAGGVVTLDAWHVG